MKAVKIMLLKDFKYLCNKWNEGVAFYDFRFRKEGNVINGFLIVYFYRSDVLYYNIISGKKEGNNAKELFNGLLKQVEKALSGIRLVLTLFIAEGAEIVA